MNLSNSSRGFSLVELLVAVLIVAILMAVAMPSYQKHVVKTKRAEAKTLLTNTAQALERCYSRNSSYTSDCSVSLNAESEGGDYKLSANVDETKFVLKAEPQGGQASRDTECGVFVLEHNGKRGAKDGSATADQVRKCW